MRMELKELKENDGDWNKFKKRKIIKESSTRERGYKGGGGRNERGK